MGAEMLLWMIVYTGMAMVVIRWLLRWNTAPMNRQLIRRFFLQHLLTLSPHLRVQAEHDDMITLLAGEQACLIHLEQLYHRCAEAPARIGLTIREAAQALVHSIMAGDVWPADWDRRVVPLLINDGALLPPDLLTRPLLGSLHTAYALPTEGALRWMTRQDADAVAMDVETLHTLALRNLERSCNMLTVNVPSRFADDRDRLVQFSTADGLDAARVLLPSFYQRFSPRFNDTGVLVAIPTRDSLAMVSVDDSALASLLAWRGAREHKRRAYPLYGDLLLVTEDGLYPWPPTTANASTAPAGDVQD